MKLILHIGDMKTGSSSIQATLDANRKALRDAGYFYPACGKYENHILLTLPYIGNTPRQFLHVAEDRSSLVQRAEKIWDKIAAGVAKYTPDTLILSAENMVRMQEYEVHDFHRGLRDRLPQKISSVQIVCYLRRNSAHYTSRLQQRIKASWLLPTFQPSLYMPQLSKWTFADDLIVREMAREKLVGSDVVSDVLAAIGIAPDLAEKLCIIHKNETISAEGMFVLRTFRRLALADKDNRFDPCSGRILRTIRTIEAEKGGELGLTKPRLNPACAAYLDRDSVDLTELRDHFGIELSAPGAVPDTPPLDFSPELPLDSLIDIDRDKALALYGEVLARIALEPRKAVVTGRSQTRKPTPA